MFELYPRNRRARLDPKLFGQPTAEYRGAPFWCWNNRLDRDQLRRQLGYLQEMGLGGATVHVRTGLATEYLGDEFLGIVREMAAAAKRRKMLTWLYDEDRWPSGFAGGLVTKEEQFRSKQLLWTCRPYGAGAAAAGHSSWAGGARAENGELLAVYSVELDGSGCLKRYRRLPAATAAAPRGKGRVWYAYLETAQPVSWYNNQTYVDTLNPQAIKRFIEVTHERYRQVLGTEFGRSVPAIFTDEPQFTHKQTFTSPTDARDLVIPWTSGFGAELLAALPELFWELPDGRASVARYRYHDQLAERFAGAFADTIGSWCRQHGIALTGHMMEEPTLHSQTHALGDAMRSYRSFDLPGIDMLCDAHEYTTAKQAQSAAHQYGYPGVLSELYGVTNWDFDFVGHKAQGDWQAALGVTVRVHHLSWVSMAGEAKRDYPASIFYQSPWYREYPLVENHFARLNTVLTRGRPGVRVGVIHPIESYWLCFGPVEQTRIERAEREAEFANLAQWLLHGMLDFNYIAESLLPDQAPVGKPGAKRFQVGQMAYDVVVVPPMRTIRSSTLDRLEAFAGPVLFAGEIPSLVDAKPSDRARKLAARCQQIPWNRARVLAALAPYRDLEIPGADNLLYQLRLDGRDRHLFVCNTDYLGAKTHTVRLRGHWRLTELDTFTGKQRPLPAAFDGHWTVFERRFEAHGHLLLTMTPAARAVAPVRLARPVVEPKEIGVLADPVRVSLSEPNALLLDQAEWRLGRGAWQPREEILRLDNLVRRQLGLPDRTGNIAQPWCDPQPAPVLANVEMRFRIDCEVAVARPWLALENAAATSLTLDGKPLSHGVEGWWVDESLQTMRLPALARGRHTLVVSQPFTRKTDLEWCYLLGDFGVELAGRHARVTAPVRSLAFGDWTRQGLPFYTGNVTYHTELAGNGVPLLLEMRWRRALVMQGGHTPQPLSRVPLVKAVVDGRAAGTVAFAPFRLALGRVRPGVHQLALTCYGHRFNAFGCVHNLNEEHLWAQTGPDAWRSEGRNWTYNYQLRPMGLLNPPAILRG